MYSGLKIVNSRGVQKNLFLQDEGPLAISHREWKFEHKLSYIPLPMRRLWFVFFSYATAAAEGMYLPLRRWIHMNDLSVWSRNSMFVPIM